MAANFNQADVNHDNRVDQGEFKNFVQSNLANQLGQGTSGYSSSSYDSSSTAYGGAGYGAGLGAAGGYESSSYSSSGLGGGYNGLGYSAGGLGGGYESSSSYSSNTGYGAGGYGAGGLGGGYESSSSYSSGTGYGADGYGSAGYEASGSYGSGNYGASSSDYSSSSVAQTYATDAQGLFQDSNPQVIRRPAPSGPLTYTQNIRVRFLQPPPVPPPGPLIIREVRPPQPPVPPPLVVRQRAPALPQPPPLVLRERPPPVPQSIASQTVIRRLAALPVPPRSVIIERLPAAPARPRDIIIERWVPYGAAQKRRTIVQRAAAAQQYARPRNVIVQYETAQVRLARQFQRLGVTAENPQAYYNRYGGSLLDSITLVQQARAAGVVEDISPPVVPGSFAATEGQFSSTGGAAGAGGLTGQGVGGIAGEINFEATAGGVGSRYNTGFNAYERSGGGVLGLESPAAATAHVGGLGEGATGFGATPLYSEAAGGESVSTYQAGSISGPGSAFAPSTLFNAADVNHDGVLSRREFGAAGY